MVTPSSKIVIDEMPTWKAKILTFFARLLGLKGKPHIILIDVEDFEPTINDLKRLHEEDEANSVRQTN